MNRDKKTLVILTPGFPPNEKDTTCLPMQQSFIRTLQDAYPSLNVIVLSFYYPFFKKSYSWFGATVVSLGSIEKGGFFKLLLRRKLDKVLKEIHSTHKVAGLLSFWYGECALAGKRFADKYGIKHYCWLLGQDAKKGNKYPRLTRLEGGNLIALSDVLQDEFEKNHGIRPQYVVPPGIDTTLLNTSRQEKDIDILAAGSLIPLKQYDIFIEVMAEIKKQLPGVKAMLIGKGPEKDRLQNLIAKAGLQDNVTLTGELPHPEVIQRMQRAKVFLHPSSYEGFSGVCLESLSAGCQVISFRRAMREEIEQWHIVSSKEDMIQKALTVLGDASTTYKKILFRSMNEEVKKMMTLFFENA